MADGNVVTGPSPSRRPLPNRRLSLVLELEHRGQRFTLGYGVDENGKIRDAFGEAAKNVTSDFGLLLGDACILLSIALQRAATLEELAHSLNRVPVLGVETKIEGPASVIGAIVEALIQEQALLDAGEVL